MGYQEDAAAAAARYGIDPGKFVAQINAESGFNPGAVSSAGCKGIAQICDAVTFDPFDPAASLDYAARRMAGALHRYGGDWGTALGSYNCGDGCAQNVLDGKQMWPAETAGYIQRILGGGGANPVSGGDGSPSPMGATFAMSALKGKASTYIVFFAAVVLLLGIYAVSRSQATA